MFTKAFWQATLERTLKTFMQTLVAVLGAGTFNLLHAQWQDAVGVAAGAAVLSVLTSVGSNAVNGGDGPSATRSEVTSPPAQPPPEPPVPLTGGTP